MRQIVVFNGSPRRDGNTTTVLDLIAKGARERGAEVKYYTLFKMKFMACQGCFACRTQDDCVINDEVREALHKVKTAGRGRHRLADLHDADDRSREEPARPLLPPHGR